jgi:hypothetical protein
LAASPPSPPSSSPSQSSSPSPSVMVTRAAPRPLELRARRGCRLKSLTIGSEARVPHGSSAALWPSA